MNQANNDICLKERYNGDMSDLLTTISGRVDKIRTSSEYVDVCKKFTEILTCQLSEFRESESGVWKFITLGNICCSSYTDLEKSNPDVEFADQTAKSKKVQMVLEVTFVKIADEDKNIFCGIHNIEDKNSETNFASFVLGNIYFLEKFDSDAGTQCKKLIEIVERVVHVSCCDESLCIFKKFKDVLVREITEFRLSGDGAWKFITVGNVCCMDYRDFKKDNSDIKLIDDTAQSKKVKSILEVTLVRIEKDDVIYCGIHDIEDEISEHDKEIIFNNIDVESMENVTDVQSDQ